MAPEASGHPEAVTMPTLITSEVQHLAVKSSFTACARYQSDTNSVFLSPRAGAKHEILEAQEQH